MERKRWKIKKNVKYGENGEKLWRMVNNGEKLWKRYTKLWKLCKPMKTVNKDKDTGG